MASSSYETGAWVISIASLALVLVSTGLLLLGLLELSGLLGPLQLGPCSLSTWRPHNIAVCLLWLPTLGAAAWLLADNAHKKSSEGPAAVEGGRLLVASLAMAVVMIFFHVVVIVAYAWRAHMRAKAMMELPTQQLLSCAQQATRSNIRPSAMAAGSSPSTNPNPPFRLQFGRSDGAFGYTLFIPAEQEEEELRRAMASHYQPAPVAIDGVPLASNQINSSAVVGPSGGTNAGKKPVVSLRNLRDVMEPQGKEDKATAPPAVVSFPQSNSRSVGSSRNQFPYRHRQGLPEHGDSQRYSWGRSSASAPQQQQQQQQQPLDHESVMLGFGTSNEASSGQPQQASNNPLWLPHLPAVSAGLWHGAQQPAMDSSIKDGNQATNLAPSSPSHSFVLNGPSAASHSPSSQPAPLPLSQPQMPTPPLAEGPVSMGVAWAQQGAPAPAHHRQGSNTSASFTSSVTVASLQQLQSDVLQADSSALPPSTVAAWDAPEEPPQPLQHTPGRVPRRKQQQQQHRRTRSHPVEPESGAGDRLDVSLLGFGDGSPEHKDEGGREDDNGAGLSRAESVAEPTPQGGERSTRI